MSAPEGEITRLLAAIRRGDHGALSDLMWLVHAKLRGIARQQMRHERADHTLQPTALINELYLRLVQPEQADWKERAHFFAAAAMGMRHILVDHARRRAAAKRPPAGARVEFDHLTGVPQQRFEQILVLDQALTRLSELNARQARIVEMKFFAGLTEQEAAQVLGVSERNAKRDWAVARAWLHTQIGGSAA